MTTTTKPDTMPRLYGLRVALWDLLAPHRAATLRWRRHNAAQPRLCPCGAPGTTRVAASPGYAGSVAPAWWRCETHAAVPLTVPWTNGQPLTGQPRNACTWSGSDNASDRITDCGCGTHIGQTTEEWRRSRTTSPHRPDNDTTTDRGDQP